jgi:hypothetical protein
LRWSDAELSQNTSGCQVVWKLCAKLGDIR